MGAARSKGTAVESVETEDRAAEREEKIFPTTSGGSVTSNNGSGMEVRVWSERLVQEDGKEKSWIGGVPAIVRDYPSSSSAFPAEEKGKENEKEKEEGMVKVNHDGDDHWVGGLNGLLKFNYPFGEEEEEESREQQGKN